MVSGDEHSIRRSLASGMFYFYTPSPAKAAASSTISCPPTYCSMGAYTLNPSQPLLTGRSRVRPISRAIAS